MSKVEEYRARADEFRYLSIKGQSADIRTHYLRLAEMWDRMAEQRLTLEVLPGPNLRSVRAGSWLFN